MIVCSLNIDTVTLFLALVAFFSIDIRFSRLLVAMVMLFSIKTGFVVLLMALSYSPLFILMQ